MVDLEVEAELVDPGSVEPLPGIMYSISLMRYKVLRVLKGAWKYPHVLVGHSMPDLESPEFRVGVHHWLRLSRRFPEHATLVNKFEGMEVDQVAFYALSFKVIYDDR